MLSPDILSAARINLSVKARSKKRLLEKAATLLAKAGDELSSEQIFEQLLERERLGSTGLSGGVALPHARMAGVASARGAFIRLEKPVDFDAIDGQPVDLAFALAVPENANQEHLNLLAQLAGLLGDPAFCGRLRKAQSADEVFTLMTQEDSN